MPQPGCEQTQSLQICAILAIEVPGNIYFMKLKILVLLTFLECISQSYNPSNFSGFCPSNNTFVESSVVYIIGLLCRPSWKNRKNKAYRL